MIVIRDNRDKRDERIMRYLNVKLDKYATEWSIKRRERKTKKV